jgi:hypothetical protein
MGCDTYYYKNVGMHISEGDDDTACVCTFPHNNRGDGNIIDVEEVYSLALIGASLKLIHEHEHTGQYLFIPNDVPEWIRSQIREALHMPPENLTPHAQERLSPGSKRA